MTTDRHQLTDADVWRLATEGCNAAEIAAYAGVSERVAESWIRRVCFMAGRVGA